MKNSRSPTRRPIAVQSHIPPPIHPPIHPFVWLIMFVWFMAKLLSTHGLFSGTVEGLNLKAKLTMRKASGFKSPECRKQLIFIHLGNYPNHCSCTYLAIERNVFAKISAQLLLKTFTENTIVPVSHHKRKSQLTCQRRPEDTATETG